MPPRPHDGRGTPLFSAVAQSGRDAQQSKHAHITFRAEFRGRLPEQPDNGARSCPPRTRAFICCPPAATGAQPTSVCMAQSTGGANAPASAGPLAASWWSAGPGRPAAPGNRRKSASADPTDAWMDSDGVEHFCWLRGPMAKRLAVLVSSRASW